MKWIAVGGVGLMALAAYAPALRGGYIWDDDDYPQNPLVARPDGLGYLWSLTYDDEARHFVSFTPQYYPLVFTTYWLEYRLWGAGPTGHHVVNLLIHLCNALLVWRIARRLSLPGAGLLAALFALHPVHVESVAWITERKNVLSGLFYLLAMGAYLRFDDARRWWWYAAAFALFVVALLSKTVACTLPVALFVIALNRRGRRAWRDALLLIPFLIVGAVMGLLTAYLERTTVGASGIEWRQSFAERALLIAPRALLFYAGKLLWPHPLMFIYPRWEPGLSNWTAYVPLGAVAGLIAILLVLRRRVGSGPLPLAAFSAVTLAPALGFVNVFPHRYSWVADHFQYLGSLGFLALYVATASLLIGRFATGERGRLLRAAAAVAPLVACAALTRQHSHIFSDRATLWEATLRANPRAWIAMVNLSSVRMEQGRFDDARALLHDAEAYAPARAEAWSNLGLLEALAGRFVQAAELYAKSARLQPRHAPTRASLARALADAGRLDEAADEAERALAILPQELRLWEVLAYIRGRQNRIPETAAALERLASLAERQGQHELSAAAAQRAELLRATTQPRP